MRHYDIEDAQVVLLLQMIEERITQTNEFLVGNMLLFNDPDTVKEMNKKIETLKQVKHLLEFEGR